MSPIAKMVEALAYRHQKWQVFADFVEAAAISLSNAVDLAQRERREERYMQIVRRYQPDELAQFPKMMGEVVLALEQEPRDVLGAVFQELDLGSKWAGQFFTPQPLADMMAAMTLGADGVADIIRDRGYVTVSEPCIGAGVMIVAACKALRDQGFNYQRQMHVTGVDIDDRAVHMAYIQLSLLGVPAIIVRGNSLTLEEREVWYTPAHIAGLWSARLRSNAPLQVERPGETGHESGRDDSTVAEPLACVGPGLTERPVTRTVGSPAGAAPLEQLTLL